jgi:hypothetical protein
MFSTMDTVTSAIGVSDVPEAVSKGARPARLDYVDRFTILTPKASEKTPEQWTRRLFGDTPNFIKRFLWQVLCGLRLRGPATDTVAGWSIGARGDDWIRLDTNGWYMDGSLIVSAEPAGLSLVTVLRYHGRLGAILWGGALSRIHRRLAPGLLRKAVDGSLASAAAAA